MATSKVPRLSRKVVILRSSSRKATREEIHDNRKANGTAGRDGPAKTGRLERCGRKSAPRVRIRGFTHAFGFMARVALAAEKMDHHPDWSNSWNKVTVDLSTHSAGSLTRNDFDLAEKIQNIYVG